MASAPSTGSLYVGDLSEEANEATLFDIFKEVGPIISIRVCRDAVTRRSLGYAYVNFQSPVDADRALETLNYQPIRGRAVRIMWSNRDPALRKSGAGNVFIKNLDPSIDNKALFDTFSGFGNILSCKIVCDAQGESKGYGFVHFESEAAAREAIARVDGMQLNGNRVYVGNFIKRQARMDATLANFTNVYVKELKDEVDAEKLKDKFSECGEVTSTCTKRHPVLEKVFGFVNFSEHDAAVKSVEEFHDKEVEGLTEAGKPLYVQRAMRRAEREQILRRRLAEDRAKRQFPPGNNLYVKNLEETMTDADLRAIFAPYGTITSCCVMKDKDTGLSRGFGFVCYAEAEASNKALSEMNGKMVGTKPLYVNVAQRKEVRRSMLEMQYAQRSRPQGAPSGPVGQAGYFPGQYPYGGMQMPAYPQYMRAPPPGGFQRPMVPPPYATPPGMRRPGMSRGGGVWPGSSRGGAAPPLMMRSPKQPARMPFQFQQPMVPGMMPMQVRRQEPAAAGLTAENLAAMTPDQQKNALGEQLYKRTSEVHPQQAAKITGMLLEMDVSETLNLLESPDLLRSKIQEALGVLRAHERAIAGQ